MQHLGNEDRAEGSPGRRIVQVVDDADVGVDFAAEPPEHDVAGAARQAEHFAGDVIVFDGQPFHLAGGDLTDGAAATLSFV